MSKNYIDLENFDFGFSAVDENELPAVKDVNIKAEVYEAKGLDTQERLDKLYNAIIPLLNNLIGLENIFSMSSKSISLSNHVFLLL